MARRSFINLSRSNSVTCPFSSAYSLRASSSSTVYSCSCCSRRFSPASIVEISLRITSTPVFSSYWSDCKSSAFSARSSSNSSVSSAMRRESSRCFGICMIGVAFFSARSVLRSLLFSFICSANRQCRCQIDTGRSPSPPPPRQRPYLVRSQTRGQGRCSAQRKTPKR